MRLAPGIDKRMRAYDQAVAGRLAGEAADLEKLLRHLADDRFASLTGAQRSVNLQRRIGH